jgi:hypothetical protein
LPKLTIEEIQQQAANLVKLEKSAWEDSTAFVTEKVAFQMRNLIRQLRKNYWGVFDEPTDPQTGRKKIWVPLTEYLVETAVKNIDLDTKDINFKAKKPEAIGLTSLIRSIVVNYLEKTGFGEALDEGERTLGIDGTLVWKTYEEYDPKQKKKAMRRRDVDLLNFYIDPTAHSIQETPSVIERAVLSRAEIAGMDWINTDKIKYLTTLSRTDGNRSQVANSNGQTEMAEMFERWGLMPKYLLTGDSEDNELVEGRIVCSGNAGTFIVHKIEANPKGIKPYEEAWYTRVPGRWYGKGVAEKVMMLQVWINTIVNIRITRSYVSQLGLFKIRKGSGVTPQMLSRLSATGAVVVNDINDIEQLVMQEASAASYKDEENIQSWGQKVTSAFEVVTGEALPADTSATATAIQSRNASSQFALIKEGVGMFLQRWLKNHCIPILMKNIKQGDLVRITMDSQQLQSYDERLINEELYNQVDQMNQSRLFVDPLQVEMERQRAMEVMRASGQERFVQIAHDIDWTDYDVQVFITNEDIDKAVISQNLITALQAAPEYRQQILQQLFDIMGVSFTVPNTPVQTAPSPQAPPSQNPQQTVFESNVLKNVGETG